MTFLQITCDNCGAKYKLPESFTGAQAKCQKCGSVIDVARQRAAASAPATPAAPTARPAAAAARPAAAAKPAVDRSRETPKAARAPAAAAAAAAKPERAARRGRDAKDARDADAGESKRGRGEREKKSSSMPLLMSGIGLVAIVVVVVVLMSGNKKTGNETANVDPAGANASKAAASQPAATPPAATPPAAPPEPKAPTGDPAATDPAKTDPPTAAATKPAEPAPPAATPTPADASATPGAAADPNRVKEPWERMRNPPATMAEVADPKSFGDVSWPPHIDDTQKDSLRATAEEAASDGMPAVRAKNKLKETGYAAIFAIIEQLQKIDYRDPTSSMIAADLNKLIEEITVGLNAQFAFVDASETIPPAKAEWNTQTVRKWMDAAAKMHDEEKYKKERAERVKKQQADK